MEAVKSSASEVDSIMQVVLNMLDEAIDDIESDNLLSEEDFWRGVKED